MLILSSFAHPQIVPNSYFFFCGTQNKKNEKHTVHYFNAIRLNADWNFKASEKDTNNHI